MSARAWCFAVALALPGAALAEAGQFLFSLNRVEMLRGATQLPAVRGSLFEPGDTVATGPTGYAQLRFTDGALVALKPGTRLKVEDYALPAPTATTGVVVPQASEAQALARGSRRTVLRLLRGAFRTATGLIGKQNNDQYKVLTQVATLGVRGTDYSMALCRNDCPNSADGLYVGVTSGAVVLTNDVSELVLVAGEYAYVRDSATPIESRLEPPEVLEIPLTADLGVGAGSNESPPVAPKSGATAAPPPGDGGRAQAFTSQAPVEFVEEFEDPEGHYELAPVRALRPVAFTATAINGSAVLDRFEPGSAERGNSGFDPDTGLSWGRWSGGSVLIGGQARDLGTQDLHWIQGLASWTPPVLPVTGTLNYTLVGNTDPTAADGSTGFLGSATLSANFSAMTVDSTLDIGINGQLWQASGSGAIGSGNGLFDGSYAVTVDGASGASGTFAGFFAPQALGAGLGFRLSDGAITVSGAAVFGNPVSP